MSVKPENEQLLEALEQLAQAHSRIGQLEHEKNRMERFFDIHDEMTQLVLNGGDIHAITTQFGKVLSYSVEVEDRFHNLLSSHTVEEFSDHYHRERVAGRYNQQSQVEDILKPYFTQVKTTGRSLTVEPQPDLGLLRRRLIAPIMVENELLGYLLLLSKSNNFTRLVVHATEHAALIYALLMMKEKSQAEVERRLQTDFLEELISGASNLNVELMNQRGHYLGFNPGAAYLFVMVDIDDFADVILRLSWCETYVRSFKREFYAVISREVNLLFKESLVVSKGDSLLILAKVTEEKSETEQTRLLISALQCSISTLSLDKSLTISIAVGGVCHNLTDYPQVARQSNLCLELLKVIGRKGQVVSYKDLGLYTILLERQNKEVLLDFASSQLRNLMEYDREHEGALVNTLRAYLANDKRLKETAVACNIHVNGLRYRMQRIEEVGQFSLDDPEICFNLQLALKILEIEKMFAI